MKILIVSTSVVPVGGKGYGGIEKLCSDFVNALVSRAHDISVAAPKGSVVPDGAKLIPTVVLPQEQDRDDLALDQIANQLQDRLEAFDVIHDFSHGHQVSKRYPNLKTLSMIWDPIVMKYAKADRNIVTLSEWQANRFRQLYNQECRYGGLMVDTLVYKPGDGARERFLFLGKISKEKGVHWAINLARDLGVGLDVVGGLIPSEQKSGYLETIRKLVEASPTIKFHFNVTEEEKIQFLQNAKAVIYPVDQEEAHWLVGVEAWACGTPTIALNIGAMAEIMNPRVGWVADDDGIMKSLMSYNWGAWDRDATREYAVRNYSIENVLPRYMRLYERVRDGERW